MDRLLQFKYGPVLRRAYTMCLTGALNDKKINWVDVAQGRFFRHEGAGFGHFGDCGQFWAISAVLGHF